MVRNCQWTKSYGVTFEKSTCSNHTTILVKKLDNQTPQSCDKECSSTAGCVNFQLGRPGSSVAGECSLYNGQCQEKSSTDYDVYSPSPVVKPSINYNKCTHKQADSANQMQISKCKVIDTKSSCVATGCTWNDWGLKEAG